jgi:spore maturation protein CgeB
MRFVIFGLTVSSSWGNGHAPIWRGLLKALAEKGHAVTFFEKDVPYYRSHRDPTDPPGYNLELYREWDDVGLQARAAISSADCAHKILPISPHGPLLATRGRKRMRSPSHSDR